MAEDLSAIDLQIPKETGISKFMKNVLKEYEQIRGKDKNHNGIAFWDIIVITTADREQKNAFELQIESKRKRNELPLNLPIHIVADPPGPKIGNGGSTLTALSFLHQLLGEELYKMKICLIHAGGQSKRMPSTSCMGKIFSPIPYGNPIYQMLDLKLAMYMPFLHTMPPGVFVACADDILTYELGSKEDATDWSFCKTGFTALAHPSSVAIGTKHGVYVLENMKDIESEKHVKRVKCIQVLQKPNIKMMYEKGAVLSKLSLSPQISIKGDVSYTDSAFFFGMDVTKILVEFHQENCPLTCEIDAYGDFLQALGPNGTKDYVYNTTNVTHKTPSLIPTRIKVFELLQGVGINVLLMNTSKFIHIGTTQEYIKHLCFDKTFQAELGLQKDCFNMWIESENHAKKMRYSETSLGCVMHSCLPSRSFIAENAVVEYCHFDLHLQAGQNSIISNCSVKESEVSDRNGKEIKIPHNMFLHTVAVKHKDKTLYTTVIFHIEDNLKKQVKKSEVMTLPYLGYDVQRFAQQCKHNEFLSKDQLGGGDMQKDVPTTSLWDLSLFPLEESMSESCILALKIAKATQSKLGDLVDLSKYETVSMNDILKRKDVQSMLNYRENLFNTIFKR